MDLKERIKVALGIDTEEQEVKLAYEAKLVDGTIVVSEADELAEGVVLNILSEDGEQTPMPQGTYSLEDGTEFTTDENGVVLEVSAKEEEEVEQKEEEEVEMEEETTTDETMLEEVGNVVRELLENVTNELNTIKSELDELRGENLAKDENIVDLQTENIELSKQVEDLGSEPSAEPVKARKFAANTTPRVELSKADYAKLSAQEKYMYNLNK
tara:strand:+ start:715 stop:1353 length:639 start_codon:yes stop_codon:yes gene_type:complete